MNGHFAYGLVQLLIEAGLPTAFFAAIAAGYRARQKKKKLVAEAPEQKIDSSLQRAQKAAIISDKLIDDLQSDNATLRLELEATRQRERAGQDRLTKCEQTLELVRAQLADVTAELTAMRGQYPTASA